MGRPAGTQCTCFTGTKVQVLTPQDCGWTGPAGTQFTCFTGTKVQILTPEDCGWTGPAGSIGRSIWSSIWSIIARIRSTTENPGRRVLEFCQGLGERNGCGVWRHALGVSAPLQVCLVLHFFSSLFFMLWGYLRHFFLCSGGICAITGVSSKQ